MSLIEKIGIRKGVTGLVTVDGVADGYEAFALAAAKLPIRTTFVHRHIG